MCSGPIFKEYTGYSMTPYVAYDCGPCPGATKEGGYCKDCTGDTCIVPPETGVDFKCYTFTWNDKNKNFTASDQKLNCKRLKTTATACNMPATGVTKTDYTSTSGCGPCKSAENDKGCKQCDTDLCNKLEEVKEVEEVEEVEEKKASATSITVLLVPLLAIIYTLF